jgi:hypothetical protein
MIIFRRIIIFYFSSILSYLIIGKLFGAQIFSMLKSSGIWIDPICIIVAAQVIGFLITLALKKPHLKQKVFNISYLVAFVVFFTLLFCFDYSSRRHQKDFGNIEENRDYFKYFGGRYGAKEKIAFDSLSKLLVDPNSFLLTGGSTKLKDTMVDGYNDTVYFSTLRYQKQNQTTTFKSEFAVFRKSAQLIFFDVPLNKEDIYRIDSLGKAVNKTFNDAMKSVPDSIKKELE